MISFDEDGSSDGGSDCSAQSDEPRKSETESELVELQRLQEVDGSVFQEVAFPSKVAQAVQETWAGWIKQAGSKEVAGDSFFTMLFDSAPSLQSAFRSPKAVISMRFMTAFSQLVALLDNPTVLKREIEALAFKHLDSEVTTVKVAFFREALIEVLEESAGDGVPVSGNARGGLYALINYIGSAYIYVHREYAGRIRLVLSSWNAVQKTKALEEGEEVKEEESPQSEKKDKLEEEEEKAGSKEGKDGKNDRDVKDSKDLELNNDVLGLDKDEKADNLRVPTSFNEMILFNASVMGYGSSEWIKIMLTHFGDMVRSVANFSRLQEECDVMSLILAKYRGPIELSEFKAVTLASMRSLLPEKWDTEHEVAWSWLWDNIEQLLKATLGKPAVQEAALTRFFERHPEAVEKFKRDLFPSFLEFAPAGQEFIKQSSTRLHFVSDKIVCLSLEMYRHPIRMVEETSAHGLRHVGYGVPTEMFPPFVSGAVSLIQSLTDNEMVVEAVRWSIALAAKIMVRTLFEGSTLVMKAINANVRNQLKKAMDIIPRGQRASELLKITAGSQSISPFYWAMDSGALTCAQLILEDLLTIRADRDVYYYGADTLFAHHPRVVQRLCATPALLFTLMDGLVWRSRQTREGWRRVNYYVKNLLRNYADDDISQNLDWLVHHGDPVIIRHPTVVLFADLLWQGLASYQFLASKLYFLLTLSIFITGQAALFRHERPQTKAENLIMFCCRLVNYLGSMGPLMIHQIKKLFADIMNHSFKTIGPLMVPRYLLNVQEAVGLVLMWLLIIMFTQEPFLWCLSSSSTEVTMACEEAQRHQDLYSCCAFLAMILFWAQLLDLAIFSMQILAYVLVWGRVVGDLALFLLAMCSVILAFATSIGSLYAQMPQRTVMGWMEELVLMALRMYPPASFQHVKSVSTTVFILLCIFVFIMATFLANLLVAQLTHTYHDAFANMKGFARLKRAGITCTTLKDIRLRRRQLFLQSLKLEEPLEFNEGDVGIPGGIQVLEPGSEHVVTEDTIKRFGGPSAPSAPWPREHAAQEEDEDKVAQLEKKLIKILKSRGKVPRGSRGSAGSNGSRDDGSSIPTAAGASIFDD